MIAFSPHIVFGHDAQIHWPRRSQHIDERFFDGNNDVRNKGVWSSRNWLSDGQIDELEGIVLQTIFEQSIRSLTKERKNWIFILNL